MELEKELELLKKEIERHNYLYYVLQEPEISDEDYDMLVKKAEKIERKLGIDTITFGSSLSSSFKKVAHTVPMLSLSNSYNFDELRKFDERVKKVSNSSYVAEAKLDGFSISLIYSDGVLTKALTRGDGNIGEDVTSNVYEIENVPKKINKQGNLEVRGEILMSIKSFNKLNSISEKKFANPRNAAAGTIRQLDSNKVKERNLECFVYQMVGKHNQIDSLNLLKELGFTVSEEVRECKSIDEVIDFIEQLKEKKSQLPYQIDGVVVKVNSYVDQNRLGLTNKSPRWAIAFKYPGVQVVTKVEDVVFQIGRTGIVTPVAHLEPVLLDGSTISRATLHNVNEIRRKDIRKGDYVFLEKGGDVIPKVVKVIESRRSEVEEIVVPEECPSCKSLLEEDGAFLVCKNDHCEAQLKKKLALFVSKEGMNIEGFGPAISSKFFDLGIIKYPEDIYNIRAEDIKGIEGFGDKAISNLLNSIERSKKNDYSKLLFSLGIRHLGKYSAKSLSRISIDSLLNMSKEEIANIDGIGEKTAESVVAFFSNKENSDRISCLRELGLNFDVKERKGSLKGQTFLITGALSKPRDEIKREIELNGGSMLSNVSKRLDYLIVGEKPGSKYGKALKLAEKGIELKILNEKELYSLINSGHL